MAKTVIGLFESQDDARSAMQDLDSAGLSDNASFAPQREPELHSRLSDAGIPQQDASMFADAVQQGYGLIIVQGVADQDAEQVAAILDRHNVVDLNQLGSLSSRSSVTRTATTTATTGSTNVSAANTSLYEGNDMVVPILEEQLSVGKRQVQGGGVRVRTTVEQIPVNEQVTLREETVTVDRHAVDQVVDASAFDQFQEGTIEVLETDEEAVVAKQARVVEEVRINKQAQDHTETISDTVRRTNVDVEDLGATTRTVSDTTVTGQTVAGGTTTTSNEGIIERGLSSAGNAAERATGLDIDRDSDVGKRDPRNNY